MSDTIDFFSMLADITMATTAVWAACKANDWFKTKRLESAENFYREVHNLHKRYYSAIQYVEDSRRIFDSQYGLHTPISEPKDKSLQWEVKSNSYKIIAELDYLASSLQMMDAMGNKLSPKSASLVSEMMEAHGRFCKDALNFNDSVWKVIKAGVSKENMPHTRDYVSGDYMAILSSVDEPVKISFELKEISFKDFYLHETTMQSVITRLKSLIARTGKNRT
ncbi:TPA: hypothetical protein J1442_003563 [Escherichia coli]|uniref:hypothetical protein n=1 Tax=Escherichia coli TaxID=562 RepID=UPI0007A0705E|nr:hypothetical protein [Escherichia coli]EEQ3929132.1 hypothetical protein [Escherichia coli]EEQ9664799.1 hypothetical protein [Escherichia coli]EEW0061864.1 hypothetical protein [Escherichia coli]EFA1709015.1 hypothetical protein [Escherichia coli]EFC7120672.1 hypothetical protein [Escherichia coli]